MPCGSPSLPDQPHSDGQVEGGPGSIGGQHLGWRAARSQGEAAAVSERERAAAGERADRASQLRVVLRDGFDRDTGSGEQFADSSDVDVGQLPMTSARSRARPLRSPRRQRPPPARCGRGREPLRRPGPSLSTRAQPALGEQLVDERAFLWDGGGEASQLLDSVLRALEHQPPAGDVEVKPVAGSQPSVLRMVAGITTRPC